MPNSTQSSKLHGGILCLCMDQQHSYEESRYITETMVSNCMSRTVQSTTTVQASNLDNSHLLQKVSPSSQSCVACPKTARKMKIVTSKPT
ncbi:hypothetical protein J437_LFUL010354 [Ladona fulva]|uniref:Uncharacterized protein n=1 Tax=Ladona fulva TaxID=123851 RepID=A0A8K0P1W6_LADFU|nr:hypothetical protein J437_LFUL010354 [Ladona fulva]